LNTLDRCRDNGALLSHGGFGVPVCDQDNAMYALHVLPLGRSAPRRRVEPRAVAALFVSSATARPHCAADLIAALYGLTPAEARVCEKLTEGHEPATVASLLDISTSTVRTHLLRIFDKIGVHRQSDLVSVAGSLATPLDYLPEGIRARDC
jgi:DNA-binding CsgD family transcriptional regulator